MASEQARKCATELVAVEEPTLDISALIEHRAEIIDRHFPAKHNAEKAAELRKAVTKLLRVLPDAEIEVAREGWGNTNTRLVLESMAELRAALADVLPAHETIYTSSDAEQVRPASFVPTECPIPPTTPEEANDILASVGLSPRPLPPLEIARRIVAPWTVYGNVRIDGKVIERAIIAVIEEERKAASEAKLSVVRYAGKRIARLEAEVQGLIREAAVATRNGVAAQTRIEELEDDLKLQRQANKFNHDEHQQEKAELERQLKAAWDSIHNCESGAIKHSDALGAVLEVHYRLAFPNHLSPAGVIRWLGNQLSPSPCGMKGHRQADLVPERRFIDKDFCLADGPYRRQRNLGPPCGRCIEVEKARSVALEEAKERLDALCKAAGGHPSLREIYTAIRGKK